MDTLEILSECRKFRSAHGAEKCWGLVSGSKSRLVILVKNVYASGHATMSAKNPWHMQPRCQDLARPPVGHGPWGLGVRSGKGGELRGELGRMRRGSPPGRQSPPGRWKTRPPAARSPPPATPSASSTLPTPPPQAPPALALAGTPPGAAPPPAWCRCASAGTA